jgi:prepilin-type N-terminal cleavage/methylation domain-containing protein
MQFSAARPSCRPLYPATKTASLAGFARGGAASASVLYSALGCETTRRRAFTLVELLVVIAIIALLAMLAFPAIGSMREQGRRTQCLANMKQLASIIMQYTADHNGRLLPVALGSTPSMNDRLWYMELANAGLIAGDPKTTKDKNLPTWSGVKNCFMCCPSRDTPAAGHWMGGKHAMHYSVNQNPGFYNRANTSTGSWPTLARIARPSRTFLLAEATTHIIYPNGSTRNIAYPHPKPSGKLEEGEGINLIFYDGHAEKFKGPLPVLPGSVGNIPYQSIPPDKSFPWF